MCKICVVRTSFCKKQIRNQNYCARKRLIQFCLYSKLVYPSLHIFLFFVKFLSLFHVIYFPFHTRKNTCVICELNYFLRCVYIRWKIVHILFRLKIVHNFTIREHAIKFNLLSAVGKKRKQQFFRFLGKIIHFIFLRKMLFEMELKAFARSRKIATVSILWSKLEKTNSTCCKTASVVDFFRNPNYSLFIILCLSMKSIICVRRTRSKMFAKLGVTEIGRVCALQFITFFENWCYIGQFHFSWENFLLDALI